MTRIHLLSDLHLELADYLPAAVDADVIVLAGDIHLGALALPWVSRHWPRTPVVLVAGNHEHRRRYGVRAVSRLAEEAPANVHVLENSHAVIDGVAFYGATLWTDLALYGQGGRGRWIMPAPLRPVADGLPGPGPVSARHRTTPAETIGWHARTRRWLREAVGSASASAHVVVTHHAPSPRSLPDGIRRYPVAATYASGLDGLVEELGADLWLHGHVHTGCDYRLGATRVVCNPRGYPGEATGFRPRLVLEV